MDKNQTVVVLVTAPSRDVAQQLGRHLVEHKIAACANIISPILSIYSWKGQIHEDEEVLLLIKTRASLIDEQLIPAVQALHPYEVPEIVALPVQGGLNSYLDWIRAETEQ